MSEFTAYIDGSCAPVNPGGTAVSKFLVLDNGKRIFSESLVIGSGPGMSNNLAEYAALVALLDWITRFGSEHIQKMTIFCDSSLVVNQMVGSFRVKTGLYKETYKLAVEKWSPLVGKCGLKLVYIPRGENKAHGI
jgi:ribonuclease HI